MKIETFHFENQDLSLCTNHSLFYHSQKDYKKKLKKNTKDLKIIQEKLYAHDRHSVLVIFQAMDAAGKDSTIEHVFSGLSPIGLSVKSFKKPNSQELDHDYLWRTTKALPPRGEITIFNRSYYEEVLVTKVHPEIIKNYQKLPSTTTQNLSILFSQRYTDILNFESFLNNNGTKIIKFFLNVSKKEQKERFKRRISLEEKHWKFSYKDLEESALWPKYMSAYKSCLEKTHTQSNPWYVIPADDKKNMRLIVSNIILEELKTLPIHYPQLTKPDKDLLAKARKELL